MRLSSVVKLVAAGGVAVAVAMIAASKSIDFERYKGALSELVEAETGRKLSFSGPVKLRLGLVPSVIAEGVTLSNLAGGSRPDMVRIERIEAEVALPALLRKEILIQRLIVSSPDILLEKGNWNLVDSGREEKAGAPTRFNLRELKIKNAKVTWVDGATRRDFGIHKLTVVPEQGAGGGLGVAVVGDALGKLFEVNGKVGALGAALAGKPWPVSLKGAMPGAIVSVEGQVGDLAALGGLDLTVGLQVDEVGEVLRLLDGPANGPLGPARLSARLANAGGVLGLSDLDASAGRRDGVFVAVKGSVRDLFKMAGVETGWQMEADNLVHVGRLVGHDLPALSGLRLAGTLRDVKGGWLAGDLRAHVGGSDLTGEVQVLTGARLRIKADLSATRLVLADFTGKSSSGGDGRLIPAQALPVETLRATDAEMNLKAARLELGAVSLSGLTAEARLHGGQLTLSPLVATLAGGRVDGSLTLDARPAQPAASVRLEGTAVDFGRLLREAGQDFLGGGTGEFKLSLHGRGASLRALAAGASGQALVQMGAGQVRNRAFSWAGSDVAVQVLGILNPLSGQRDTTEMACAVVHFRLKDGVAASDKGIAVQADGVDVVGSGTVDLRDEGLDLGFTPRAKDGLGLSVGGQLAGFSRLRGTLAAPSLSVDEIGAARTALSVGAAAATGGLSLLGELLFDKATADATPCRTALAMGSTAPAKGKGGGGLLEGLFGR